MTIPRLVHVCWFGGASPTPKIERCLRTIDRLKRYGYDVRFWTEDNYDLAKSPRLVAAHKNKRWSLVSNYVRLDVLREFGGIYLDADIEVVRPFDDLLDHEFFIGYIWDCTLGTAVIGAAPGHWIVSDILTRYDDDASSLISPNNNTFTDYFLDHCPGFALNGREEDFSGIRIMDKYAFEHPSLFRRTNYTVHHLAQSWISGSKTKYRLKNILVSAVSLWIYRKYVCWHSRKISPYYQEYLRQSRADGPAPAES